MQWYYAVGDQQNGPVEPDVLWALARDGKLKPDDLVWNAAMGNQWARAATVPGLFPEQPSESTLGAEAPPLSREWTVSTSCRSQTPNRDLMTEARNSLTGNWGIGVITVVIYTAISIVLGLVPVVGGLVSFAISGPLMLGWLMFFLGIARQEHVSLGTMFQGFNRFGTAFLAALLVGLLVFAWMLPGLILMVITLMVVAKDTFSGVRPLSAAVALIFPLMLAAIIPAVMAQLRYSMTFFAVADDNAIGALEAIQRSKQMMNGNKGKLFCLQCRFIGWGLLCLLSFGIGLLWLIPYYWTSVAKFYEDLRPHQQDGSGLPS